MTLNCGAKNHDDNCLCDVVVKEPAPIMGDWVRDSWLGKQITERLGLSSPWSDDNILSLLETQTIVHDRFIEQAKNRERNSALAAVRAMRPEKISDTQKQELKTLLLDGATSGQLKKHCATVFGVEISRSWACKLRVRLLEEMGIHEVQ